MQKSKLGIMLNLGPGKLKKNNPTSIFSGAVPDDGEQAQPRLGSLKLLPWPPTFAYWGYPSNLSGTFFCLKSGGLILRQDDGPKPLHF